MSTPPKWSAPPEKVLYLLSSMERCRIIVALLQHEWVPSTLLAGVARLTRTAGSQQLAVLRKAKVVEVGMGRLYRLNPALRPPPGVDYLDFGVLRLPFAAWH